MANDQDNPLLPKTEVEVVVEQKQQVTKPDRDANMFADWLYGKSFVDLAKRYQVNKNTVVEIAKKNNWKSLKKEFSRRAHRASMARINAQRVKAMEALDTDLDLIHDRVVNKNQPMTPDERYHLRLLVAEYNKEFRLESGTPTEINQQNSSGTVKHELWIKGGTRVPLLSGPTTKVIEEGSPDAIQIEKEPQEGDFD